MKVRVISAIIMILIGGALIYFGGLALCIAAFLFSCIGLFEFYRAFRNKGVRPVKILGYLYTLLIPAAYFLKPKTALDVEFNGTNLFPVFQLLVMLIMLTLIVVRHRKVSVIDCAVTLMGAYYVPFLFSFFVLLRDGNSMDGLLLLVMAILGSVAADTCALFAGILYGKKKLIPEISPKKTVAGSIGAFVGSTVVLTVYGLILHYTGAMSNTVSVLHFAIMGLLLGGSSQIGDLSASAIKRYCGIKDFGKLIPGHGGILDRFDSMLFNVPIVYCYLQILNAVVK